MHVNFKLTALTYALCLAPLLVQTQSPPSNLPPVSPGVFAVQGSIEVSAPIEVVWEVLLDFPSYPDWNPFARSMVVANALGIPLADQTPHENLRLIISAQIPPLPPPVSANTPPNLLHAQESFENITHIDHVNYRAAWRQNMLPGLVLNAERWSALSTVETEDGEKTFYESREVFGGPGAYLVQELYGDGLQKGFDAQALALKEKVEG